MTLEAKIEAILFWKAEPLGIAKLATLVGADSAEVKDALTRLSASFEGRGITLVISDDEAELRTAPGVSALIEKLTKDELMRDLGKAGLETLSIILYRHPIKRSEIDYIRGVNSSFILRNLLMRGLIERLSEKEGESGRGYSYKPTIELLSHLGVAKMEDLPDYARVKAELEAFEAAQRDEDSAAGEGREEPVPASADTQ
ncbi:MAG: SMC-Scp complex subunit ScpB [Candidatus Paceibacterota bacterium]|jgi:segregation and condensation protein B